MKTNLLGRFGPVPGTVGLLPALLLLVTPLFAGDVDLHLELDRDNGCYTEGETAMLTIRVNPRLLEEREWLGTVTSTRDWNAPDDVRPFRVSEDAVPMPFTRIDPGQVTAEVTLRAESDPEVTRTARIGMLFQPDRIALSTPEPKDFDAFWKAQKAAWRSLASSVRLVPVESPHEGVLCWDLTIELEGEAPVSGYLALPEAAGDSDLPALLLLHGAGVRSSNLGSAARYAAEGFMALDINAHGLPNNRPDEFYEEMSRNTLPDYRQRGSESRETWYFRTMYLRIVTAMDFLCDRPEWNGRDLVLRGSSQGGGQALAGAGLDPRVTVVAASVPALCDLAGETLGRKAGWPQPVAAAGSRNPGTRAAVLDTVGYFDGGIHARRSRAETIVSLGLADPVCPAVGIQAMANQLAGPVTFLYRPAMAHAIPPDIQEAFDRFTAERVSLKR